MLKKAVFLILYSVLLFSSEIFAHRQHVHQYICTQAYQLLKLQLRYKIPVIENNLENSGQVEDCWVNGKITDGAYLEDASDIVYGYSNAAPPTLTGPAGEN